jgi:hypothetical protein
MSQRPSIWRAILDTQWKWTRGMLVLMSVVSFALPLLSLRASLSSPTESVFIASMQAWSVGYGVIAAGLGLVMSILAWSYDHRLRHVYALSLPIPRWQYVLLRFAAGLLLLTLPILALFVGTEVVAASSLVPKTLHSYPVALTLRFAFATLVAYAVFFAVSSATAKTAGYILGTIGAAIVAQVLLESAGSNLNVVGYVVDVVLAAPGLLAVFNGRWMLIDV